MLQKSGIFSPRPPDNNRQRISKGKCLARDVRRLLALPEFFEHLQEQVLQILGIYPDVEEGRIDPLLPSAVSDRPPIVTVVAELDSNVLVTLTIAGDQLAQTQSAKLTRGHSGCKGLSRQRDHGRASPEDVHAGGVPVAERSVQAHVHQLAPAHVLLLRRHIAEDKLARFESHLLGSHMDVGFTNLWES